MKPSASTQSGDATAKSEQQEPSNENFSLRTYEPGSDGSVTQINTSVGEASATNDGQSGANRGCVNNVPDARTTATSRQKGASNTNASVHINSPGENGAVTQVNSSEATATASDSCAATQRGTANGQEAPARATATQDSASNTNASVRVFSDGDNGEVTQANTSEATAKSSDGGGSLGANATALAEQTDSQNVNVSIRAESGGKDGPANQRNNSTAVPSDAIEAKAGAGGLAVSVSREGQNIDVAIALERDSLPPLKAGEFWLWRWEWCWEGDPDQMPDWGAVAASIEGWTWNFSDPNAASACGRPVVEKVTSASGIKAGTWTWKWGFTNEGQSIDWSWEKTLDGCNCAWIWTWSWAWVDAKDGSPTRQREPTAARPPGVAEARVSTNQDAGQTSPSIIQSNSSSSAAHATNESRLVRGGDGSHAARQSTHVNQSAAASARSTQSGAHNSAGAGPVKQARSSSAEATAANTSSVSQSAGQAKSASGTNEQSALVVQSARRDRGGVTFAGGWLEQL